MEEFNIGLEEYIQREHSGGVITSGVNAIHYFFRLLILDLVLGLALSSDTWENLDEENALLGLVGDT